MTRFVAYTLSGGLMVMGAGGVCGQTYPNKPIRFVATAAGGSNDFAARLIAPALTTSLGQPVIVENRSSGVIATETVAKAPPDGYTVLVTGGAFWVMPLLQKMSYDPVREFAPITLTLRTLSMVVVHPSLPVKSVKELIALAKARPGELNYASSQTGSSNHLAGELFKSMAGVNIVRIAYKGGGPALNGLIGGEVHLSFASAGSGIPHVKAGRLRALAVTSAEPSALLPGVPTVAATVPGYEFVSHDAILAPAKTPGTIINRLNQEIVRVINQADVKQKFNDAGIETVGSSPEQLAATMKSEMAQLGKLIKDIGIKVE